MQIDMEADVEALIASKRLRMETTDKHKCIIWDGQEMWKQDIEMPIVWSDGAELNAPTDEQSLLKLYYYGIL